MRKIIYIILIFTLVLTSFSGCSGSSAYKDMANTGSSGNNITPKIKIVTTIFPVYDWVKNILGETSEAADLSMLVDNGVDLHSYQPSTADIVKISSCDLFIYVGGESDEWVKESLDQASNKSMTVISLIDILGDKVKTEELVEGMESYEAESDTHDHNDDEEADEHVWLSVNNTILFCDAVTASLKQLDPKNADLYQKNADSYKEKLSSLDTQYRTVINDSKTKTLLFGDRFPFRYLTDDYGLNYYAAFAGCSAETEASFNTIVFLAKKVDELGLKNIIVIDGNDKKIAETIRSNTETKDQEILSLNSMQGITSSDIKNGKTYISVMTENLNVLKEALK